MDNLPALKDSSAVLIDSLAVLKDSSAILIDSLAVLKDSSAVPMDSLAVPIEYLAVPMDSLAGAAVGSCCRLLSTTELHRPGGRPLHDTKLNLAGNALPPHPVLGHG